MAKTYFDREEVINLIDRHIGETIRDILSVNAQTVDSEDKEAYVMVANRVAGVIDMADHVKKEMAGDEEA